jgi:hypothetical protein
MEFVHRVLLLAEITLDVAVEKEHPTEDELRKATSDRLEQLAQQARGTSTCVYVRPADTPA